MSLSAERFRSRGPVIAAIGGVMFLLFMGLAWHRGRCADWLVFTPLAATMALLAAAAVGGFTYTIGADVIEIRLLGFSLDRVSVHDVTRIEIAVVSPLWEYGGWGIRGLGADRTYLMGSRRGVRVQVRDHRLFLGYEEAEALCDSIRRYASAVSL